MKQLYFTVTNDLTYDQRMHRICTSLADNGFQVTLVGRVRKNSKPLKQQTFNQKRIKCFFDKSFLFYAEYNLRLFFFLLTKNIDGICAIDLDTIIPGLLISGIKGVPRIYDAHEYFTELKEVNSRPLVKKIWTSIEKFSVPKFKYGYTVSDGLASIFNKNYHKDFIVIRNLPRLRTLMKEQAAEKVLLYQGAVNEGRGFEYLIPAMKDISYKLVICGDGNFMQQLKALINENNVQHKIELKGMLEPDQLWLEAQKATVGIALAEQEGLNQFMALPNKFFDYIQAGLPQLTMNYPEYEKINNQFHIARLINDLRPGTIAKAINDLMTDQVALKEMHDQCIRAREVLNWQMEEKKLISYYQSIFSNE